jgi:hypothetical protein
VGLVLGPLSTIFLTQKVRDKGKTSKSIYAKLKKAALAAF